MQLTNIKRNILICSIDPRTRFFLDDLLLLIYSFNSKLRFDLYLSIMGYRMIFIIKKRIQFTMHISITVPIPILYFKKLIDFMKYAF